MPCFAHLLLYGIQLGVAIGAEPTAWARAAILSCSLERWDLVAGQSALTTKVGSSGRRPPREPCAPVPWFAWLPAWSWRSGEMCNGGGWASCEATHHWPSINNLGSENCFLSSDIVITGPWGDKAPSFTYPISDCLKKTFKPLSHFCIQKA